MSKTPFMKLWIADFIGDTLELSAQEVGAYMLLLMTMWHSDGWLPDDSKKLKRICRIERNWPAVWRGLSGYFEVAEGRITNARLTKELNDARTKSTINSNNGARGGRAKALKNNKAAVANAKVSLYQPESEEAAAIAATSDNEKKPEEVCSQNTDKSDVLETITPPKTAEEKARSAAYLEQNFRQSRGSRMRARFNCETDRSL